MSFKILAIGEILWDLLPAGRQLGGAPANYALNARSLGADAALVSCVGTDALGQEIVALLRERGLPLDTIQQDATASTGTVGVEVAADGQPQFTIHENVAWDRLEATSAAMAAAAAADAVCFGSLGQRNAVSRRAFHTLLAAVRLDALRIFDINIRAPFWSQAVLEWSLHVANALKLNEQELPLLAGMFGLQGDVRDQVAGLANRFQLNLVGLTRGAHGSLLYADGEWSEHPGLTVAMCDAVGAGDAFAATLSICRLQRRPLEEINQLANEVAAYVCTQPGATPLLPDRLRAAVQNVDPS